MNAEVIKDSDRFDTMAQEWDDLLVRSGIDNVFLSHAWLVSWWKVFGMAGELYIIRITDAARGVVGLLPCYRARGPLGLVSIRFLGSRNVSSDFLDLIADQSLVSEVVATCCEALAERCADWDLLEFADMDLDSNFLRAARSGFDSRFRTHETIVDRCPFSRLPGTWDEFLATLSKKNRAKVGYYRRALDRSGVVELETISDPSTLDEAVAEALAMRSARLRDKGVRMRSIAADHLRFHRMACNHLLAKGNLELSFIRLNGRRVAFAYQFRFGHRFFFYQTGFELGLSKLSPGLVLLSYQMERAIATGCRFFEFLRGEEPYKYQWGEVQERQMRSLAVYGWTRGGAIRFLADCAKRRIRACVRWSRQGRRVPGAPRADPSVQRYRTGLLP